MGFDDEDRKNLSDALQDENLAKTFFEKNRLRIKTKREEVVYTTKLVKEHGSVSQATKDLIRISTTLAQRNFETFSDVLDLIEITLLHSIQTRKQVNDLVNIMQESESERKSSLAKIREHEKTINNLSSHEKSLKWIDEYFRHSSETSHD